MLLRPATIKTAVCWYDTFTFALDDCFRFFEGLSRSDAFDALRAFRLGDGIQLTGMAQFV